MKKQLILTLALLLTLSCTGCGHIIGDGIPPKDGITILTTNFASHVVITLSIFSWCYFISMGFSGGFDGKESACNARDLGLIPGLERPPGEGHGNQLLYSCLENPHGQRCLAGYSPWGCKELDTTEPRSTAL